MVECTNTNDIVKISGNFDIVRSLWKEMPWEDRVAARSECFFSERSVDYTYGAGLGKRTYSPVDDKLMPAIVEYAKWRVEDIHQCKFEACFINGYVNERQALGWHSDDSELIDHSKPIVVISFGASRDIWVRPIMEHLSQSPVRKYELRCGSMFVMPPGFQQTHQHRIPKHSATCAQRISLTFRALI